MLIWEDAYSTGNAVVDQQHRRLFDFFNDITEIVAEGRGESYIQTGFRFLEDYARAHFGFEENCMFQSHCRTAETNKTAHADFLDTLEQAKAELAVRGYSDELLLALHGYLENWIKGHILHVDTALRDSK